MIRFRYWQKIFIFLCIFVIYVNAVLKENKKSKVLRDESLFFDRSIPDYETVLTPADFEMSAHMSESMQFTNEHNEIWDSEGMYNTDKFEGDIANDLTAKTVPLFLTGGPSNSTASNQHNAIRNRRQLWSNGKIPYALSSQYSSYSRSVIASSMQEYSKHTCVEWVPKTNADTDYVYIMPDRGCYSMVGKTGGKQVLSLGNGCIQKGIIIHEMMHAVGFFHEQSRTDRDDFITIMWNNIQPGMQGQFEKYSTATIQALGTEYDYTSIMHYGPKAFSRNGLPTIVPKHKATIGQRSGFSSVDSHKINTLYGCPSTGGQTTLAPPTQPPVPTYPTLPPQPVITYPPQPTTGRPYPSPPTTGATLPPPPVIEECRNTRPDCDQLAQQGWCQRNPKWMKDHCPISCGMCKPKPVPECEDLRVDCAELVKRRYCIMAQSFTKSYCAKSCGFCFVPPVTEVPDPGPVDRPDKPTAVPNGPMVTFWPTLRPKETTTATPATPAPITVVTTQLCEDRKHFCGHWKKAGFCEGIFMGYMKKNCPKSCGFC